MGTQGNLKTLEGDQREPGNDMKCDGIAQDVSENHMTHHVDPWENPIISHQKGCEGGCAEGYTEGLCKQAVHSWLYSWLYRGLCKRLCRDHK